MAENTIKETMEEVVEYIGEAVATKENAFRVTEMPEPSEENAGDIIQYIGETTANYINGYFYKCVLDDGAYKWVESPTGSAHDARVDEGITKIEAVYDDTRTDFRVVPVISVDLLDLMTKNGRQLTLDDVAYCKSLLDEGRITQSEFDEVIDAITIPSFSSASDTQLDLILSLYYNGYMPLSKITSVWKTGDTRDMNVDAIASTNIYNGSSAQTVQMMIVDINKNTLVSPKTSVTKALLSLNSKNCLSAVSSLDTRNTSTGGYGWYNLALRAFLRTNFYNALPSTMKTRIKNVNRSFTSDNTPNPAQDTIYILSEEEANNGYSYYNSSARRIKNVSGTAKAWWLCNEYKRADGTGRSKPTYVGSNGSISANTNYTDKIGVAPAFCI